MMAALVAAGYDVLVVESLPVREAEARIISVDELALPRLREVNPKATTDLSRLDRKEREFPTLKKGLRTPGIRKGRKP